MAKSTATSGGWLARATSLLEIAPGSAESGWVALNRGMFEGERERRRLQFREAVDVARAQHDANPEFTALAYLGASLVHDDRQGPTLFA